MRWPHYVMRPCINSRIDLAFLHICRHITRLVLFFHRCNVRSRVEIKCQLAPRTQYISTMKWIVYFSGDWFVDFTAIFLLWDSLSLFWGELAVQTTPYLFHGSCLYKESSVCCAGPAVYCAIRSFDFAPSFSLGCACFSHYVKSSSHFLLESVWREPTPNPLTFPLSR